MLLHTTTHLMKVLSLHSIPPLFSLFSHSFLSPFIFLSLPPFHHLFLSSSEFYSLSSALPFSPPHLTLHSHPSSVRYSLIPILPNLFLFSPPVCSHALVILGHLKQLQMTPSHIQFQLRSPV